MTSILRLSRPEWLVILLAVLARAGAAAVFQLAHLARPYGEPWAIARSLAAGKGFAFDWYGLFPEPVTGSFLPPLYPWLLSLTLHAGGGNDQLALTLAQLMNVALGAATCWLVMRLAADGGNGPDPVCDQGWRRRLFTDRPLQAGLFWAVYPPALGHVGTAHTTVLEGFLLALVAWRLLAAVRRDGRWLAAALASGVALGLLLLVRPSHGLVWGAWGVILLLLPRTRARSWRPLLVCGLVAAAVLAPWTVRNWRVHDAFVPVATNGGFNFYVGHNPQMAGDIPALDDFFGYFPPDGKAYWQAMDEVQRDRELYRRGLAHWREDPGDAVADALRRLQAYVLWRDYLFAAYPRWLAAVWIGSFLVLTIPFLLSLPRVRAPAVGGAWVAFLVTALVGMAYVVSMRFRASVEPLMAVAAAVGWGRRSDGDADSG